MWHTQLHSQTEGSEVVMAVAVGVEPSGPSTEPGLRFLWLELTGRCNLHCVHCYADSSPTSNHGTMTTHDWEVVLDQAQELGVRKVQFIGGEPTLHPGFRELVIRAS